MKLAKLITALCLTAMTVAIAYGFVIGDFGAEGQKLLSMPWGIVSMVDLYTGFTLFSLWIIYREPSRLISLVWVILMMVLGFWTGALYTLIALHKSRGDWRNFWLGKRA